MGSGAVQLVSPMLTNWVGAGTSSTAAIGIMKVSFAPEPSEWMLLASGDLSALSGFDVPFRTGPFERLVLDFDSATPTLGLILPTAVPLTLALRVVTAGLIGLVGIRRLRSRTR
jgi:hypothetical protein